MRKRLVVLRTFYKFFISFIKVYKTYKELIESS